MSSAAWDRFFFAPVPPTAIALYRVAHGVLLFAWGVALWPEVGLWMGERGLLSRASAARLPEAQGLDLLALWPAGDGWLHAFLALFLVAAACLAAGLCTRSSAVAAQLMLLSLQHRQPLLLTGVDEVLRVNGFFLMFAPAGAAISLDRRLRGETGPPAPVAPWAQRLIQLQLSILYLSTFCWKLQGTRWLAGDAVYYATRLRHYARFAPPVLLEHRACLAALTWGTLALEGALPVLIWYPRTRRAMIAAGLLFHLALELTLDIPLFQWSVAAMYLTFLTPEDLP